MSESDVYSDFDIYLRVVSIELKRRTFYGESANNIKIGGKTMDSGLKFPYIEGEKAEIFYDGEWKQGVIVAGYRFREGVVTIQTDDGQKIWCGEAREELYRKIVD